MKLVRAIYSDIYFVSEILEDLGDSLKLRFLPKSMIDFKIDIKILLEVDACPVIFQF